MTHHDRDLETSPHYRASQQQKRIAALEAEVSRLTAYSVKWRGREYKMPADVFHLVTLINEGRSEQDLELMELLGRIEAQRDEGGEG